MKTRLKAAHFGAILTATTSIAAVADTPCTAHGRSDSNIACYGCELIDDGQMKCWNASPIDPEFASKIPVQPADCLGVNTDGSITKGTGYRIKEECDWGVYGDIFKLDAANDQLVIECRDHDSAWNYVPLTFNTPSTKSQLKLGDYYVVHDGDNKISCR